MLEVQREKKNEYILGSFNKLDRSCGSNASRVFAEGNKCLYVFVGIRQLPDKVCIAFPVVRRCTVRGSVAIVVAGLASRWRSLQPTKPSDAPSFLSLMALVLCHNKNTAVFA